MIQLHWLLDRTKRISFPTRTRVLSILITSVTIRPQAPGSYSFPVPATDLTTAPAGAKDLLVVASASVNDPQSSPGDPSSVLAVALKLETITPTQLVTLMPGLPQLVQQFLAPPLNTVMNAFGITSLEQRAMFLAQIGHEKPPASMTWDEIGTNQDFTGQYWIAASQWTGLGRLFRPLPA